MDENDEPNISYLDDDVEVVASVTSFLKKRKMRCQLLQKNSKESKKSAVKSYRNGNVIAENEDLSVGSYQESDTPELSEQALDEDVIEDPGRRKRKNEAY